MLFAASEEEEKALVAGLHHATFLCVHAREHDVFWTKILGLRRVKQTVDYDCPDSYLLYYGNETGAPGTIIGALVLHDTAAAKILRGTAAAAKAGKAQAASGRATEQGKKSRQKAVFAVRPGALPFWRQRLRSFGINYALKTVFGREELVFSGPCGEQLGITEALREKRRGRPGGGIAADKALCGLYSLSITVPNRQIAADLLYLLGYRPLEEEAGIARFALPKGNGADILDIEEEKPAKTAANPHLKAGALAHFAFALAEGEDLAQLREMLLDKGYKIGGLNDNTYFSSFYLYASQGGLIVEVATNDPGFEKDEGKAQLGAALQLPRNYEHLRQFIMSHLESLVA